MPNERQASAWLLGLGVALLAGCNDMVDQPKQTAYGPQVGPASEPSGMVEFKSQPLEAPPLTLRTAQHAARNATASIARPAMRKLGDGQGMIVQRGFPPPPSFHIDRLRQAPPQYFYDVITEGHGAMYSFADKVEPQDRWAIAAYIRALQRQSKCVAGHACCRAAPEIAMTAVGVERGAWLAGGLGLLGSVLGWMLAPALFPHAWLAAFVCWIGWPLGSMALILIHSLTGGRWGFSIRPQLASGVATVPLAVPALLPVLLLLDALYPWMNADLAARLDNHFYLNAPFFYARCLVYLVIWIGLGFLVRRALRQRESRAAAVPHGADRIDPAHADGDLRGDRFHSVLGSALQLQHLRDAGGE